MQQTFSLQWYKIDETIIVCFDYDQNTTLQEDIYISIK